MNENAPRTSSELSNPASRTTRTHQKDRTVPRRRNRRTQRLFSTYRSTGDTTARDLIYRDHLHIAEFYARKYSGRGVDYDDLFQEAGLGLLMAIDRYDPTRKVAFSTYASCVINGSIKQYFRDRAWPCSVPRKTKDHALRIKSMERSLGRIPTKPEVIEAGIVPTDQIDAAILASMAWSTSHLNQSSLAGVESQGNSGLFYVDTNYETTSCLIDMEAAMQKLDKDEMDAALLHYFGHLSQKDVAQQMGISAGSVSKLLRRATKKLGHELEEAYRASW